MYLFYGKKFTVNKLNQEIFLLFFDIFIVHSKVYCNEIRYKLLKSHQCINLTELKNSDAKAIL